MAHREQPISACYYFSAPTSHPCCCRVPQGVGSWGPAHTHLISGVTNSPRHWAEGKPEYWKGGSLWRPSPVLSLCLQTPPKLDSWGRGAPIVRGGSCPFPRLTGSQERCKSLSQALGVMPVSGVSLKRTSSGARSRNSAKAPAPLPNSVLNGCWC